MHWRRVKLILGTPDEFTVLFNQLQTIFLIPLKKTRKNAFYSYYLSLLVFPQFKFTYFKIGDLINAYINIDKEEIQWILDTTAIFRLSENWCSSEIDVVLRFDLRKPENDT